MSYGLLGKVLGHSRSPEIHRLFGNDDYRLYEVTPDQLEEFMTVANFDGINVTVPYKEAVIPYLAELSPAAKRIGAVNTVIKRSGGDLYGDNTDYFGFVSMIDRAGIEVKEKKCLVLGSGGASKTAVTALSDMEASEVIVISRKGENNYGNIDRHFDASVIVNTTPVGMYPDCESSPLSLEGFYRLSGVADVIYNPRPTRLLRDASDRRIATADGLYMLVGQARKAVELFMNTKISDEKQDLVFEEIVKTL